MDAAPQLVFIFLGPVGDLAKLVVFWVPPISQNLQIFHRDENLLPPKWLGRVIYVNSHHIL